MVLKHVSLVLLFSCVFLHHSYSQDDCAPEPILQLMISANATLYWTLDEFQYCEITHFQVNVTNDSGEGYFYEVTENYLDLSFLEICEEFNFTVIPMSYEGVGFGRTLSVPLPLPPDADLSLTSFKATSLESKDVLVEWDLVNNTYGNCSLYYQLRVTDEDLDTTQDVYVWENSVDLTFPRPCISHHVDIRAINGAQPNIEGAWTTPIHFYMPAKPQIIPSLFAIDIGTTSVNMTWTLEGISNRCPLKALYLDGGSYFNISVPIQNVDSDQVLVELRSLQSNSMYYFNVYVENSGGVSPAFNLAVQTLDIN
ncbi:uncharacterized protein LOC108910453 [Anoplophora glabripennis]|uniref:uncharacterized protein LOC108910453 n=1 Tax=Anoplophora glabripennis TaxID=217634 RepID=UPI0008749EA4|nr:uncharacterized protein LOC108910453 [Anoplophora glabripennis]